MARRKDWLPGSHEAFHALVQRLTNYIMNAANRDRGDRGIENPAIFVTVKQEIMRYTDEEIQFAFRLLNERESLDEEEVDRWIQDPAHRLLLNEMAGARQRWESATAGDESSRALEEMKSRRSTLRSTIVLVIVMIVLLVVSRLAWR